MFNLTLLTPSKKIVQDVDIKEVFVPGHQGEIHILPGHSPLMTTLKPGVLRYRLADSDKVQFAAVSWGYAEVSPTGVNVLAETAETPSEIDLARSEKALEKAENELSNIDIDAEMVERLIAKAEKEKVRQEVAKHSH